MYGRVPPVCSDLDEKTTKNSESKAEDSNDTIENSSNAATKPKNVRSDLWKVSQHAFNFCTCSVYTEQWRQSCCLYEFGITYFTHHFLWFRTTTWIDKRNWNAFLKEMSGKKSARRYIYQLCITIYVTAKRLIIIN